MDQYQKAMLLIAMSNCALQVAIANANRSIDQLAVDRIRRNLVDDLARHAPDAALVLASCH